MLAAENRKSLMIGVPGIILQIGGNIITRTNEDLALVGLLLLVLGSVLLCVGLGFYAKAKGHHPAFGLLGLLSILGLIILALMPDKHKNVA